MLLSKKNIRVTEKSIPKVKLNEKKQFTSKKLFISKEIDIIIIFVINTF